jgi:hypothetical protein
MRNYKLEKLSAVLCVFRDTNWKPTAAKAVDIGEGFMDPMEEAALQQMIAYTFIGGPEKVKKELDYFIEKLKLTN